MSVTIPSVPMRNQALGANGGGAAAGATIASARHGRANAITRPVVVSTNSRRVTPEVMVSSIPPLHTVERGSGGEDYAIFPIGNFLIRLPVPAKIALQTAGAIGGVPGSPTPPCASVLGTMWTSTSGISARRSMR